MKNDDPGEFEVVEGISVDLPGMVEYWMLAYRYGGGSWSFGYHSRTKAEAVKEASVYRGEEYKILHFHLPL